MVTAATPRRKVWRPLRVGPSWLALILAGGMVGTAVRAALETACAPASGFPWATFCINVSGAFALGALLEALAATGPDQGWRRAVRLGVGTGLLGGYTTYSTFAVETMELIQEGAWAAGLGYAMGSVVAGFVAAVLGIRIARLAARRREGAA